MAQYETHSREILLHYFREQGQFSGDRILNNDLSRIELAGIGLFEVEIKNSFLTGSVLEGAETDKLDIDQCDLKEINFIKSKQQRTGCYNSYLIKADFSGSHIYEGHFRNCIAHSIRFKDAKITGTTFQDCQMFKSRFLNALLMKVVFASQGVPGDMAGLSKSQFNNSMAVECSFKNINMDYADFTGALFIGCDFTGASLEGVDLSPATFIECRLPETCRPDNTSEKMNPFS